jgi:hypothetical protein
MQQQGIPPIKQDVVDAPIRIALSDARGLRSAWIRPRVIVRAIAVTRTRLTGADRSSHERAATTGCYCLAQRAGEQQSLRPSAYE